MTNPGTQEASKKVARYMNDAIYYVESFFGDDARYKFPSLVGDFIQACATIEAGRRRTDRKNSLTD